jgi:membrane-associated PAP2 superfamily phosphatase
MSKRILLGFIASAAAILWIGARTDLDFALARTMYDASSHSFPWRHAWFAEAFSHGFLRALSWAIAAGVGLAVAWDAASREGRLTPWWRKRLRVVGMAAVLVPLTISTLKYLSASHCPWDLVDFGGTERYVRLLQAMVPGTPAGHCMPAGHASSALWMMSVMVFWLPHKPRTAALVGAGMAMIGFGVGWVQQMRGAHFLTHTLWSVWIASAIIGLLCARLLREERPEPAVAVLT